MKKTKIPWTDYTWNPWQGCKKISTGCTRCYMFKDKKRWGQDGSNIHRSSDKTFNMPLHLDIASKIFTCSWSDFFIEQADPWRDEAWKIIKDTPYHTYQILTKRPERISQCLPADWGEGYDNVWLGVTVEEMKYVERLETLNKIPALYYFVSCEPLLGDVVFRNKEPIFPPKSRLSMNIESMQLRMGWVIIGTESGPGRRPAELDWIYKVVRECKYYQIPVFVKQLEINGKVVTDIEKFPEELQVRQFPMMVGRAFCTQHVKKPGGWGCKQKAMEGLLCPRI